MADQNNSDPEVVLVQDEETRDLVTRTIEFFFRLYTFRVNYHQQWEEVAALIWPECRNTFEVGSYNYPGMKFTQSQLDSTGMLALDRFTGIIQHLLTPSDVQWHGLTTQNPELNKVPAVARYFERVTNILFAYRYAATSNFAGQCVASYKNLGAFGTHALFIDELDDPVYGRQGIRYRALPMGEIFLYENHQGQVIGLIRYFRMTAKQCHDQWGFVPPGLKSALEQRDQYPFEFIHHVGLRKDFQWGRPGPKGMPWRSDWISLDGKWLMQSGSFPVFPYAVGRHTLAPREPYGRSPAMQVLPSLKSINAMRGMFYRTGARIADPVLLINDEGFIDNVDLSPGALNSGGVDAQGHELIKILPTGNLPVTENMMQSEAAIINTSFLNSLFDILIQDRVEMTATEVLARAQEKGALLSPMIGRQTEFLSPMIDRELSILARMKKLPPMPPELREARGEYQVEYTSPLNNYMRAGQAAGFMRTVESMMPIVQAIQDPSIFDIFNFERAFSDIADIQAVPASYMATDREKAQKAQQRMQQLQAQMQIQAAPGQAGLMSAQAKVMKVQAETGQTGQPAQGGPGGPPQAPPPGAGQAPPQYGPPPGTPQ